jgi:hypothetical protein
MEATTTTNDPSTATADTSVRPRAGGAAAGAAGGGGGRCVTDMKNGDENRMIDKIVLLQYDRLIVHCRKLLFIGGLQVYYSIFLNSPPVGNRCWVVLVKETSLGNNHQQRQIRNGCHGHVVPHVPPLSASHKNLVCSTRKYLQ